MFEDKWTDDSGEALVTVFEAPRTVKQEFRSAGKCLHATGRDSTLHCECSVVPGSAVLCCVFKEERETE